MKERLIFFICSANNRNLKYFNLLDIFMYLNLKTEFANIQILMSLSMKRVSRQVLTAHILRERAEGIRWIHQ